MKLAAALLVPLVLFASPSHAEDSVGFVMNYFKERSTRIYEPFVRVAKELPLDIQLEASFLVDNITSASIGFTGISQDELFSENRWEARTSASVKLFDLITPGVSFRYSEEPDYKSFGWAIDVAVSLFDETTTLKAYLRGQDDDVHSNADPSFEEDLDTWVVGAGWTQVWRKDLITGVTFESQVVRGFQENEYRANEQHPRIRDRFSVAAWASYHVQPTRSTIRVSDRFYIDSWDVTGNTFELSVAQSVVRGHFDVIPRYRFHTQSGAYFSRMVLSDANQMFVADRDEPQRSLQTQDPKLEAFDSHLFGIRLRWTLAFLRGTPLEIFETVRLVPSYAYQLPSDSYRYGPAHIAEAGLYWPF